jgi:predicted  nucleic acid-binding Zn-ribbon protein
VLGIYETEADIDRQRENQLDSVQRNMDVYIAYLRGMNKRISRNETKLQELKSKPAKDKLSKEIASAKLRVKDSRDQLGKMIVQKEQIIAKFKKEKEIYMAYKARR